MKLVLIGILIAFITSCGVDSSDNSTLEHRPYCVVEFKIDEQGMSWNETRDFYSAFARFVVSNRNYPVTRITFPSNSREYYYIQFSAVCDNSFEMTEAMVREFLYTERKNLDYQANRKVSCSTPSTLELSELFLGDNEYCDEPAFR